MSGGYATAQDVPPPISIVEAKREISVAVDAEGVTSEFEEVSSMQAGPFNHAVALQVSGNLGSIGYAIGDHDTQISSLSMSGSVFMEASTMPGGGEDAATQYRLGERARGRLEQQLDY